MASSSYTQDLLDKILRLPDDKIAEVADFVEFLCERQRTADSAEERLRVAAEAGLITPPDPGHKLSSTFEAPPVNVPGKPLSTLLERLSEEDTTPAARGRAASEQLLAAEGGAMSSEELGATLGITRQAVNKRRRAGKLLAVRPRGDWLYPRWQVADGQVLDGLEETLSALSEGDHSAWDMLIFFVATDTARGGESPLDALRAGRVDAAVEAARMHGELGAR